MTAAIRRGGHVLGRITWDAVANWQCSLCQRVFEFPSEAAEHPCDVSAPECDALQHDPEGVGPPLRCGLPVGHDGLHDSSPPAAEPISAHDEHPWHQVGRCVYCGPCSIRLYQGTMPPDHPRWTPSRRRTAADDMRARWGKD